MGEGRGCVYVWGVWVKGRGEVKGGAQSGWVMNIPWQADTSRYAYDWEHMVIKLCVHECRWVGEWAEINKNPDIREESKRERGGGGRERGRERERERTPTDGKKVKEREEREGGERERERDTYRQTDRQRQKDTETETDRQAGRQ